MAFNQVLQLVAGISSIVFLYLFPGVAVIVWIEAGLLDFRLSPFSSFLDHFPRASVVFIGFAWGGGLVFFFVVHSFVLLLAYGETQDLVDIINKLELHIMLSLKLSL